MKLNYLRIRNVLYVDELDIKPELITLIVGRNRTGKTAIIEAVKAVVAGGKDPTLLRHGAEDGEIILETDDFTIRKPVGTKSQTPTVKGTDGEPRREPQSVIRSLLDSVGFNPIEFLNASEKRRVEILLECLPVTVTAEELKDCGVPNVEPELLKKHGLEVIDAVYEVIYDKRTGSNSLKSQADKTVQRLLKGLEPLADDVDEALGVARENLANLQAKNQTIREKVQAMVKAQKAEAAQETAKEVERLRSVQAGIRRQILELEKACNEIDSKIAAANEQLTAANAETEQLGQEAYKNEVASLRPQIEEAQQTVANLEARKDAQTRLGEQRRQIEEAQVDALEQGNISQAYTLTLDALQALKAKKLDGLPLKGVEVRKGQIFAREGENWTPFDRLNDASKIGIVCRIIEMRVKNAPLKLVVINGFEQLDRTMLAGFLKWASSKDIQFIVTRVVSDLPRRVITMNKAGEIWVDGAPFSEYELARPEEAKIIRSEIGLEEKKK